LNFLHHQATMNTEEKLALIKENLAEVNDIEVVLSLKY
jgi:hypothetical protein